LPPTHAPLGSCALKGAPFLDGDEGDTAMRAGRILTALAVSTLLAASSWGELRLLRPRRVLVLAVGREPLVSLLASRGIAVIATDRNINNAGGWAVSGQHSSKKADLWYRDSVDWTTFDGLVEHRQLDMTVDPRLISSTASTWCTVCAPSSAWVLS
jgi:hypothetical protein